MTVGGESGEAIWAQTCDEALAILGYALMWELPEQSWEEVWDALGDMARAATDRDADLLTLATGRLELCSPLRSKTRLGDSVLPAPVRVKERVEETVTTLGKTDAQSDQGIRPGSK